MKRLRPSDDRHGPGGWVPVVAALLALLAWLPAGCGGPPPLALVPKPVRITHDGFEVFDAAWFDADRDGDLDFVAATEGNTYYLRQEAGTWRDETPGTRLNTYAVMQRLHPTGSSGLDFVVERDEGLSYLTYTGIGSWDEEPERAPDTAPEPVLEVVGDFDGDGRPDRARAAGRRVTVELQGPDGRYVDRSRELGVDALGLRGTARRLMVGDVDGDGDTDLAVVGGRLFVLVNNGGVFEHPPLARAATRDDGGGRVAHASTRLPAGAGDAGASPVGTAGSVAAGSARGAPARPWFVEATRDAGLEWRHVEGDEQWDIRPTMGPGVAFADVDGDGDEDLYVVGGSGQDGALFLNDGGGAFTEATAAWGLLDADGPSGRGAGMGASFCDWDDDGDPDLYVTRDGPNVMWRHDGDRFTDVTAQAGTGDSRWGAGAAWADFDRDGDLDLFLTNYLLFDTDLIPPDGQAPALRREDPIAMLPYVFPGQADVLYRNEGDGTFVDVSATAGIADAAGKGLGVITFDHDDDGWPDVLVANDTTPNVLWRNLGKGAAEGGPAFEEIALFVGLDDPRGGMGVAFDDVDRDGDEDLFVTYWQLEPNGFYRNNALHPPSSRRFVPRFEDVAVKAGLAQASVGSVGWGCALADLDNDGDSDLMVANGYTSPDYETTMTCVGQPDQLFENTLADAGPVTAPASLAEVPRFVLRTAAEAGPYFDRAYASRGVAAADVDGDGDLDLVVTANNGPLVLLRNERGGRSLRVVPEGRGLDAGAAEDAPGGGATAGSTTPGSTTAGGVAREAVGARVTLTLDDGSRRSAVIRRGGSYLSGHERGVRFGLGTALPVALAIDWPDGSSSTHPAPGEPPLPDSGTCRPRQPGASQ